MEVQFKKLCRGSDIYYIFGLTECIPEREACKAEIEQALKVCDYMDARWSNNSPEKKIENQVIRTPSNDEVCNERKVLKLKNERQNTTSCSKYYKQDETPRSVPSMKPNLPRWGGLSNQEVFTLVHQQVEPHRSDTATSDKDKQFCFVLMPRTWFKMEEFTLE